MNEDKATDQVIYISDLAVFDQTYKTYFHPLHYYAKSFVDPDDAKDIIENLFLKVWKNKQTFKNLFHLKSFLYQSVKNACLDFIKVSQNDKIRSKTFLDRHNSDTADHLNTLIEAEVLGDIYRAINDLPTQCSKIIWMSYFEGLSNSEIAEKLGLSEQTIKNHKGRGLNLLKGRLSGDAFALFLLFITWK